MWGIVSSRNRQYLLTTATQWLIWKFRSARCECLARQPVCVRPLPLSPGSGFRSATVWVFLFMSVCGEHMKQAEWVAPVYQWQILFTSASPSKLHMPLIRFTIFNMQASVLLHLSLHLYLVLDFFLEDILQVSLKIFASSTRRKYKTWLFCTHVAASDIEFCILVLAASNEPHRLTKG